MGADCSSRLLGFAVRLQRDRIVYPKFNTELVFLVVDRDQFVSFVIGVECWER